MKVIPYLLFDGNAEEALTFYQKVFSAETADIMRYSESPGGDFEVAKDFENKIMHAELKFGNNILYLSDNWPGSKTVIGTHIAMNLMIESEEELQRLFKGLSEGGSNLVAPSKQFWGSIFGSLDDQYGIHWSLNYDLPQE